MKKIILTSLFMATLISFGGKVEAAVYNSKVANPFVFCSMPKPCKKWCQPWRSIWEEICPAGQITGADKETHEKGLKEMAKINPELVAGGMTAESFRKELGKATMSAFSEDDQYVKEVADWIKYNGNQISNGKKVSQIWCEQGIQNPLGNPQLRQMAYNDIVKKNQKIVELISNGTFPPKDSKTWYDFNGNLTQCQINNIGN
jgi:hypothetical protein